MTLLLWPYVGGILGFLGVEAIDHLRGRSEFTESTLILAALWPIYLLYVVVMLGFAVVLLALEWRKR